MDEQNEISDENDDEENDDEVNDDEESNNNEDGCWDESGFYCVGCEMWINECEYYECTSNRSVWFYWF